MSDTLREIESFISRAIFSESRESAFALRDSAVAAIEQIEHERDEARKERNEAIIKYTGQAMDAERAMKRRNFKRL